MAQEKTFTGETMQEVMEKVKSEVGEDALIVSNRVLKKSSLTQKGLYEVVVKIPDPPPKKNKENKSSSGGVTFQLSKAVEEINKVSRNTTLTQDSSSINRIETEEIKKLQDELQKLAGRMELLQSTMWDMNSGCRGSAVIIPPEFSEIYVSTKNSGISRDHLDEIMSLTIKHMPVVMRQNPVTIKRYFYTLLKKMILIRKELEFNLGKTKIMMFVGPTGVGKTTTIAKLAARYAKKNKKKRYKVGIVTLDSYRIGAVEQLMRYATMMQLPIETVVDPNDFVEALNRLRNNDIILVDTVGSSQHDKEKLERLTTFLDINTFASIDVTLVLSATTKYEDLKDIYNNFSILPLDTFIFTKLDETQKFGNLFSLAYDTKKPVSYFSIGQEVPDDLIVATKEYLVQKMLKDIK
jgi:flagellar biosynthesis protein FlhF